MISFIGIGVTGGTPATIVHRLSSDLHKALDADTVKRLVELGGEPRASSPEEMRRFIQTEIDKWRRVVAQRNIERE